MLRLLLLPVPELAVRSQTAALNEVLAQWEFRLVVIAILGAIENVRRQFAGRPETLLLVLRAVEKLAARPVTHAVLKVVAERVLLHGIVLGSLVQILATLPSMAHIPQKVPADSVCRVGGVRRVCVQSARHTARLSRYPRRAVVQLFLQLFHRWSIAIVRSDDVVDIPSFNRRF